MASLVAKTNCEEPREFSDFVSQLTEGLCVDFPMYLHRVASTFKAFESSLDLHVVTVATFYSQLMLTDSIIETSLLGKVFFICKKKPNLSTFCAIIMLLFPILTYFYC